MPEKLTSESVSDLIKKCLLNGGEDGFMVQGVLHSFVFDRGRIDQHKTEIISLLAELPDDFRMDKGGGWSFLNACMDRHGRHWGEHPDMEALFCLGIAIDAARWLMPREMWDALPGGMPYVAVTIAP